MEEIPTIEEIFKPLEEIYLDYNASTPLCPEVCDILQRLTSSRVCFGNPSSSHCHGESSSLLIRRARLQVSSFLNCPPDRLVFTSGGTESNNTVLQCFRPSHLVISSLEHPAIANVAAHLSKTYNTKVETLPVSHTGLVDPRTLESVLARILSCEKSARILVSIMHANNEVGTVQPIAALASVAHKHGAFFHTDAAQSAGKVPIDVEEMGVDALSLAGHKLYAPKGVGALYVRNDEALYYAGTLLFGAGHEKGRRPGTENVLGIAALGEACAAVREYDYERMREVRDVLRSRIEEKVGKEGVVVNGPLGVGDSENVLPNTLSIAIKGTEARELLRRLKGKVAGSAGAACHSGVKGRVVSGTLAAMGVEEDVAVGTLRLSVGRFTSKEEAEKAGGIIADEALKMIQENTK